MMKKIYLVILALIIVVAMTACGNSEKNTSPSSTTTQSQKVSQNTENITKEKLNVSVPAGWEANKDSVLEHHYMKNTASFMVKIETFTAKTLDEVVTEAKGKYKNAFKNYKDIGATEDIKIDGKDAKKIVFTCDVGNYNMKYMYVYVFVGKDIYVITFGDLQKSFDSLSSDYQAILNSITIK